MTDVSELVVRIRADAAQLDRAMRDARGSVETGATGIRSSLQTVKDAFKELLPVLTVGALVEFGKSAFESADHINDLALRIGFAGSTLSALNIPLKQSGSNLDEFSASVNRMNAMIGEAAKGTNQEAVKAFDSLGLSVRKLQQLNPEQQFYAIAAALNEQTSQAAMTEKGMNIFGRSFSAIAPLIKEAKGNIAGLTEELKNNGLALTVEQLKRIDELGDRWTASIEKLKLSILEVVPLVEKLSNVPDYLRAAFIEIPQQAGEAIGTRLRGNPNVSRERPETVSQATFLQELSGPLVDAHPKASARGDNSDLLRGKDSALKEYIKDLGLETQAVGQSERALAVQNAVIEGAAKAKDDYNNHLRDSKSLLPEEQAQIEQLTGSYYDLKKAQEENERAARQMKDQLADSLADIAVNFDNLKDSATNALQAIAKEILKAKVTTPLANSIIDAMPSFSFGKMLGFADGGTPPVGVPSVVGENGPELFVPSTAGTIVPNHKLGGSSVSLTQHIQVYPGVAETVDAKIRAAMPVIAAQAQAGVFAAMQKGGAESRITGLRS